MNKKFLSAVLFGALMVSSTGTFVSCKDYDDDIKDLQSQVTANADAIKKLQDMMGQGQYVTGISKTDAGLVFSMSNGGTSVTIPIVDGQDGKDGTIITIDPETNNWVIDGKDTGICAKGEKGDKGEAGEAGEGGVATNGHSPKIDEATGCWTVWDDAKQAWVVTDQSAIGAQTYVVSYPSYFELNVMEQDADGKNLGFKSIKLPISGTLLSITPELNGRYTAQDFDIYYGILTGDVEWKGHKAVNGKMLEGMYPTADRDIKMLLNPTDVDVATGYTWSFVSTDNTTPWGLTFGEAKPWSGKATTITRGATSDNGLWTLPRDVQRFDLNSAEMQGRPDYVQQFKANDGNKYLYALKAVSTVDNDESKAVRSSYVYTFKANNVNSIKDISISGQTYAPSGNSFVYNKEYTPSFDIFNTSANDYEQWAQDSVLVYDYYLEIDKSKITDESIRKYGLEITADGYSFIAKNAAVVNNTVWFKYNYILINGKTGSAEFGINFNDEEATVTDQYIGDFTAPFNATVVGTTQWYALNNTFDLAKFFEGLGTAGKLKWIDAIARSMGNSTDANEINKNVFSKKTHSTTSVYNVELLGGDPINNQATWDAAAYNGVLLNQYIDFDYVDATGKTCLTGNIRDLDKITGLKVTFLADSELGRVDYPYYTVDNKKYNGQGVALPLDNAFRIQIATRYDQYEVSKMNFSFELKMPTNCPIKRETVGNQTSKWDDKQTALTIYGQKSDKDVKVDMRDAFVGAFEVKSISDVTEYYDYAHAYGEMKPEAEWYKITWKNHGTIADKVMLIGVNMLNKIVPVTTLSNIVNSSEYAKWNTIGFIPNVFAMTDLQASVDRPTYATEAVEYDHFGIYAETLSNFTVKFASKVEDSQKAGLDPELKLKDPNTIEAKAVYEANGVDVKYYTFSVSNASFTMADAFNNAYSLFDGVAKTAKRGTLHIKLNEATQGIERDDAAIATNYFGLYPIVRSGKDIVFSSVPSIAVTPGATPVTVEWDIAEDKDKTYKNYTGMTFKIPGGKDEYANDKTFEITFNVTDVFGTVKPFTFYARTVNVAIGEDNKPIGEE